MYKNSACLPWITPWITPLDNHVAKQKVLNPTQKLSLYPILSKNMTDVEMGWRDGLGSEILWDEREDTAVTT